MQPLNTQSEEDVKGVGHMLDQRNEHHGEMSGQMDALIHQNEQMIELLKHMLDVMMSDKKEDSSEASLEGGEPKAEDEQM